MRHEQTNIGTPANNTYGNMSDLGRLFQQCEHFLKEIASENDVWYNTQGVNISI